MSGNVFFPQQAGGIETFNNSPAVFSPAFRHIFRCLRSMDMESTTSSRCRLPALLDGFVTKRERCMQTKHTSNAGFSKHKNIIVATRQHQNLLLVSSISGNIISNLAP
jgi:hypothetical protein